MFSIDKHEPMQVSTSPITWFVAFLLLVGVAVAVGLFLRVDWGEPAMVAVPSQEPALVRITKPEVTVLVVALGDRVEMKEFGSMEKCSEAASYIRLGTERRVVAQCVTK